MSAVSIQSSRPSRCIGAWTLQGILAAAFLAAGAVALLVPGLASIGALWLGSAMVGAVVTHVFVLHTSPVPAIVLGVLNALVVYLRRDELVALLHRVKG